MIKDLGSRLDRFKSLVFVLTFLVIAFPGFTSVSAQVVNKVQKNAEKISFKHTIGIAGTVSSVIGTRIELLNGAFVIDGSKYGSSLSSFITEGMYIQIAANATQSADDPIVAKFILNTPTGYGILLGSIQGIDLSEKSITLLNYKIFVDQDTNFLKQVDPFTYKKLKNGLADFKVGDPISCGGVLNDDSQLIVTGVILATTLNNGVDGVVKSVNGSTVQLLNGTLSVDLSNADIFAPGDGDHQPISSVTPGMFITVPLKNPETTDTSLQATSVTTTPVNNAVLKGTLQSIDPVNGTVTVLNHKLIVDDRTQFYTKRKGGLKGLKVGESVEIEVKAIGSDLVILSLNDVLKVV